MQVEYNVVATDFIEYEVLVDYPDGFTGSYSDLSVIDGRLYVDNDLGTSYPSAPSINQTVAESFTTGNDYYISFDFDLVEENATYYSIQSTPNRYDYAVLPIYYNDNNENHYSVIYDEWIYSNFRTGFQDSPTNTMQEMNFYFDNIMVFDLTVIYGAGNEPDLVTFELILDDAPDYFDEWSYNYYEEDSDIVEYNCERDIDNLITNGDMVIDLNVNGIADGFTVSNATGYLSDEVQYLVASGATTYWQFNRSGLDIVDDSIMYVSVDYQYLESGTYNFVMFSYGVDGATEIVKQDNITDTLYRNISVIYDIGIDTSLHLYTYDTPSVDKEYLVDNLMLFDLSTSYGNLEPDIDEFELLLDDYLVDGYTDGFTIDDTCFMSIEQSSPMYQYYTTHDADASEFNIVLTETLYNSGVVELTIAIAKYTLDMEYVGMLYEGNITDNGVNGDGYVTHTFNYELDEPTVSEEGYIYVAYDVFNENVYGAGYVYHETSTEFNTALADVRAVDEAVGINGSVYLDIANEYQFDETDPTDYMFNATNMMTLHFRIPFDVGVLHKVTFYNENTVLEADAILFASVVYDNFCDVSDFSTPTVAKECIIELSANSTYPPLLNYLNGKIEHNFNLFNAFIYYEGEFLNFFSADGGGVYSYETRYTTTAYSKGETIIYFMTDFYEMWLSSRSIRLGRNAVINIVKNNSYLDANYTYQYLFDSNTGLYDFEVENTPTQELYLDVYEGVAPDDATVYYHLQNVLGAYLNGSAEDVYDTYLSDYYTVSYAVPFTDNVDNWMDMIGMNSVFGKILIASVTLILVTIGVFYASRRNILAVMIVDFIVVAILTIIGVIPLWIILLIIMLFFGALFIKGRRGE